MPYTGNPSGNLIDVIRLQIGDTWPDLEILADADYQYILSSNNNSVSRSTLTAARMALFKLSRYTREKTGEIEVYGEKWAQEYRAALLLLVNNPNLSIEVAMPYFGGISKRDMRRNDQRFDNVRPDIYIGFGKNRIGWSNMWGGVHQYDSQYTYDLNSTFTV